MKKILIFSCFFFTSLFLNFIEAAPRRPKLYSAQCLKTDGTWVSVKFLPSSDYIIDAARQACKEQLGTEWAGHEDAYQMEEDTFTA